jgi:hypothetical protein
MYVRMFTVNECFKFFRAIIRVNAESETNISETGCVTIFRVTVKKTEPLSEIIVSQLSIDTADALLYVNCTHIS